MSLWTGLTPPRRDVATSSEQDYNVDYELCAASERAKVLLQTTQQVKDQLDIVRVLRRQRSAALGRPGKEWIDQAITHTVAAISTSAQFAEPVPEPSSAKRRLIPDASFLRHLRHMISDSSQMTSQLAQLSVASQSLNTAMSILLSSENHTGAGSIDATEKDRPPAQEASWQELSELMNRRRKPNVSPLHSPLLPDKPAPFSTHDDAVSQVTTDVVGNDDLERRLARNVSGNSQTDYTLVLTVETVEKWRQAVDDVLEKATQASSTEECSHEQPETQPSRLDPGHVESLPTSPINRPSVSVDLSTSKQQRKCESLPATFSSNIANSSQPHFASRYNRYSNRASIPRRKPVSALSSPQSQASIEKNATTSPQSNPPTSPTSPSLLHGHEKQVVSAHQVPPTQDTPLHEEADLFTPLEIDPEAWTTSPRRSSSPRNFLAKNLSQLSLTSISAPQPFQRSRARAWLERQADSQS